MGTMLMLTGADWQNKQVPCKFAVVANGVSLAATDPAGTRYEVPTGTTAVKITATPTVPTHWPTTIEVAANGFLFSLAPTSPGMATVTTVTGPVLALATAVVKVSRFKEVTKDILKLLQTVPVPRGANAPPESELKAEYGAWPPPDLDIHPVPGARFLDATNPVKDKKLNLAPAAALKVEVDTVVLELAGVTAPRLFGVTWPKAIAPKAGAAPMPTLLHFRQSGGQDAAHGVFTGGAVKTQPYPYNFDYAERCLFESMHYAATPLKKVGGWTLRPKGVPYQIAKAGKDVVAVYPVAHASDKILYGVLSQMKQTGSLLEELQAFMFWRARVADPPATIGNTAMSFYSSLGWWLPDWLRNADNLRSTFLKDTVKAIYFLDTVNVPDCINAALGWAKAAGGDKRIRLYSRFENEAVHKSMIGPTAPGPPYVATSTDGKRSFAVLPETSWELLLGGALESWDAHHFIPASALTHAISLDF